MNADDIVCWPNVVRYYGDNPKLLRKYRKIIEIGKCPFCPENIRKDHQIKAEAEHWIVVQNQFPYRNSALHFLIIPKRHLISLSEISTGEWVEMAKMIATVAYTHPFLSEGYGLAVREGKVGGVTICHLHWHLIAPKVEEEAGQIAVNFGIG